MVVVGLMLCTAAACSGDDDGGSGSGSGEGGEHADPALSTTTTTAATTTSSSVVDQGPVDAASTGTGPVDGEHPCGALSVAEVTASVPGVVGARRNGTSCYYVTEAGDDALAVDIPPTGDTPADASVALVSITAQYTPSHDPTTQGCQPVDLASAGPPADEAVYCIGTPPTLVLRRGTLVLQLLDLTPATPPDETRLRTLARTTLPRLP